MMLLKRKPKAVKGTTTSTFPYYPLGLGGENVDIVRSKAGIGLSAVYVPEINTCVNLLAQSVDSLDWAIIT